MIEVGRLRDYVTIQAPSNIPDTAGQTDTSFVDFLKCWAQIEPLSGRELINAQALESPVSTRVRIRYANGLKPGMQVQVVIDTGAFQGDAFDGGAFTGASERILGIQAVIDVENRHRALDLLCIEIQ